MSWREETPWLAALHRIISHPFANSLSTVGDTEERCGAIKARGQKNWGWHGKSAITTATDNSRVDSKHLGTAPSPEPPFLRDRIQSVLRVNTPRLCAPAVGDRVGQETSPLRPAAGIERATRWASKGRRRKSQSASDILHPKPMKALLALEQPTSPLENEQLKKMIPSHTQPSRKYCPSAEHRNRRM